MPSFSKEKSFPCPYCGSLNYIQLDNTASSLYNQVVDCEVCCRPIVVRLRRQGGYLDLEIHGENE